MVQENVITVDGYAPDNIENLRTLLGEYISTWYSSGEQWHEKDLALCATLGSLKNEPDHAGFLALVGGIPAGCVLIKPHDSTTLEVMKLYVRPEFRKRGVGRKLMLTALERATGAGRGICGQVEATRTPAINLYESLGLLGKDSAVIDGYIDIGKPHS
jgi:GNAT superfamily N-acetyltransferase